MAEIEKLEIARQDSDNGGGLPIDGDGLADCAGVAPHAAAPKTVKEKRDFRRVGKVLLAREVAARQRLYTERGKETGVHPRASQASGITLGQVAIDDEVKRCDAGKRRLIPAPSD